MPLYWFKGPVGEPFQFQCGPDGIHVPGLADKVKLKPRPLELNGVVVDFDKSSGYLSMQDAQEFIQGLGGSTETAIPVDGQPAGAAAGGTAAPGEDIKAELVALRSEVAALKSEARLGKRPRYTHIFDLVRPAVLLIFDVEAGLPEEQQLAGGSSSNSQQGRANEGDSDSQDQGSRSYGRTAMSSAGTAVLVGPGTALTACHNLPAGSKVGTKMLLMRPRSASTGRREELSCSVQAMYEERDLAILSVEKQQQGWLRSYEGEATELLDMSLSLATYSIGLQPDLPEFDTSLGLMPADPVKCNNQGMLLYKATTFKGCSGSPLVTAEGALVGIHVEGVDAVPQKLTLTPEDLIGVEKQQLCLATLLLDDVMKQQIWQQL